MFRIITPTTSSLQPPPAARPEPTEDILMEDIEGSAEARPSTRVGSGRVTGPGEVIADSGKWMRCASSWAAPAR